MPGDQVDSLARALNGQVQSVRIAAVGHLASLGTSGAAFALIDVLEDDNRVVGERAYRALGSMRLGREHVTPLVHLAAEGKGGRIPALTLLAPLADDERVPPLFVKMIADGLWRFDGYDEIRKALARHGRSVVPELCALLDSDDETVRRLSFTALTDIGDQRALGALLDHLAAAGEQERSDMSYALRRIGPVASTLAAALQHPEPVTRAAVVRRLGAPTDIPVLEVVLRDPDRDVRLAAVSVLSSGKLNRKLSKAHVPLVKRMLADPDPGVRRAACEVAFRLPADVAHILAPLISDEDSSVRAEAVKVLGWCQRPELVPALSQALGDEADSVRVEAIKGLGSLARTSPLPVDELIALLNDRERFARCAAVEVLGVLKERRAVQALCELVFDIDEFVSVEAARALGAIGDEAAVPTLSRALATTGELTRRQAAKALVQIGTTSAFNALTEAVRIAAPDYAVINALAYVNNPKALPALELISAGDSDWGNFTSLRDAVDRTMRRLRQEAKDGGSPLNAH